MRTGILVLATNTVTILWVGFFVNLFIFNPLLSLFQHSPLKWIGEHYELSKFLIGSYRLDKCVFQLFKTPNFFLDFWCDNCKESVTQAVICRLKYMAKYFKFLIMPLVWTGLYQSIAGENSCWTDQPVSVVKELVTSITLSLTLKSL